MIFIHLQANDLNPTPLLKYSNWVRSLYSSQRLRTVVTPEDSVEDKSIKLCLMWVFKHLYAIMWDILGLLETISEFWILTKEFTLLTASLHVSLMVVIYPQLHMINCSWRPLQRHKLSPGHHSVHKLEYTQYMHMSLLYILVRRV